MIIRCLIFFSASLNKVVNRLIDYLFANPVISSSALSKAWEVHFPTVQRGVDYLIEKGILREITRRRRNRLFVADEIFNTIMTERAKSMNQKGCDMNETNAGLPPLPDGWAWTTLEEVSKLNPRIDKQSIGDDLEVTFLPMKNVKELSGKIDLSETKRFSELKRNSYTPFRDGDILFAKVTPCMENGKIAITYDLKNGIGFGSTEFHVIRLSEEQSKQFFFFYFLQQKFRQEAKRAMTSGVGLLRVPTDYMRRVPIPLPPLPEQHRIVAKIEELFTKLDAGINALHKAQSQLKRYRQSVLKAAFEGKLTEAWRAEHQEEIEPASALLKRILKERRDKWEAEQLEQMRAKGKMPKDNKWKAKYKEPIAPDTSDLPELPNGWTWATVGSIGLVASGKTPKGINDLNLDGEIPFYKISDMNKLGNERFMQAAEIALDDDQTAKLGIHVRERGTVIFPKRGGAIATNKKRILSRPSAYDLNIMGVLPYIVPTDFFYQWLLSIDLAALSDGSNVPQLNHKDIDPLPFPLPPLFEQQAIVSEVDSRLSVADEVEKTVTAELKRAEQLRQSILKKAFSGKLVPQDPNDEPASVLLERIKAQKGIVF